MSGWKLLVILVAGVSAGSSVDTFKNTFCNVNYPEFVSCLRTEGNSVLSKAFDKCKDEVKVNTTDSEFGKEACNDNNVKKKFLSCLGEEKRKENNCAKVPESCYKKAGIETDPRGLGTLNYFCSKPERFCCIKKQAPKSHLKAMQKCLKKIYDESKKFLGTICKQKTKEVGAHKIAEWKDCYMEEIGLNKTHCSPSYIKECKDTKKPC